MCVFLIHKFRRDLVEIRDRDRDHTFEILENPRSICLFRDLLEIEIEIAKISSRLVSCASLYRLSDK